MSRRSVEPAQISNTISLRHIPDEGLSIQLSQKEEWFRDILNNLFDTTSVDWNSLAGKIHIHNADGHVTLSGDVSFKHQALCARCAEELSCTEYIPLHAFFEPEPDGITLLAKDEEVEMPSEDEGFCFYTGEEFDIAPVINDEIALSQPYNRYCADTKACEARVEILKQKQDSQNKGFRWGALADLANTKKTDA